MTYQMVVRAGASGMGTLSLIRRHQGEGVCRVARIGLAVAACVALANCASSDKLSSRFDPRYGVASSPRVIDPGEPIPKGGGTYRVGKPYVVAGHTYVPNEDVNYREEGLASWYGDDFHGRLTANGEVYDMEGISAAHPTLPMPSYARVTNLANGKSIIVRVNDRGPYHQNRVIDLSVKVAHLLDFHNNGVARVRVEYVGRAPLEGSDDRMLMATLREGAPAPAPSMVMLASSKPFVPEMRQRLAALRSVPMPPDRPFTLGASDERYAAIDRAPSRRMAAETADLRLPARVETVEEAAYEPPPRAAPVVAAFASGSLAPASEPRMPASVMSGRGLY